MRSFNRFFALTAFPALLACAQDISGDWQGTLKAALRNFGFSCKSPKAIAESGGPRC